MISTIKTVSYQTHIHILKKLGFKRTHSHELLSVCLGFKTYAALKSSNINASEVAYIVFDTELFYKRFNAFQIVECNEDVLTQFLTIIEENTALLLFKSESDLVEFLTQNDSTLVNEIESTVDEELSSSMSETNYNFDELELNNADFDLQTQSLEINIEFSMSSSTLPDKMVSTGANHYEVLAKVSLPKIAKTLYSLPDIESIEYAGKNTFYDLDSGYEEG